jgi:hypothetical protein
MFPEEVEELESIHRKYPYDDLLNWRRLTNAAINSEEQKKKEAVNKRGFFGRWFASEAVCRKLEGRRSRTMVGVGPTDKRE